ncbi:MAG: CorA family divalent cation transporter [Planctomycetaceae bacterium]
MNQPLLPAEWTVPQIFRDRLGDEPGRQRSMESDGHLLLVLHKAPKAGQNMRTARILWRDPEGTWKCNDGTDGLPALEQHLSEYDDVLMSLDDAEHNANEAKQYLQVLTRLAPVLRAARHQHATLQSAREAVPKERALINARDHAYRLERTIELLMSDARGSLDVATLQQSEEQATSNAAMAQASHRLNILAALFLPLATISGLLGVDFPHPGRDGDFLPLWQPTYYPFWGMVGVGLGVGILIAIIISRRQSR